MFKITPLSAQRKGWRKRVLFWYIYFICLWTTWSDLELYAALDNDKEDDEGEEGDEQDSPPWQSSST